MSWVLGSYAVLAVALGAGLAWWERTRPSSRLLALVATLAALAALGRVAFAPLPNVKPTTDIVLLAGFALGAAPGFAVGAVAALASNVVFGQGPWTPWQMLAWGLCGLLGAGLGALTGRQAGRLALAATCGAAGLAFGAIMDFSLWTTYSGQHTLGQYAVVAGGSLPFNLAHAVGNVVFCLAFGPALVRALMRYRTRLQVTWLPAARVLGGVLLAGVLVAGAVPRSAEAATPDARATAWLRAAAGADGGWGAAPRQAAAPLETAWAAMGLAAAGVRCPAGTEAVLRRAPVRDTGDLERTILGLRACGADARELATTLRRRVGADGSVEQLVNRSAFAVLALRATGVARGDRALGRLVAFVAAQQNRDGGFSFAMRGAPSGTDDTAAALQAVRAGGGPARVVRRAAAYLRRQQRPDGGFGLSPGAPTNAQSTAWAIQGLVAAGQRPERIRRGGSRSAVAYLRSLVGPPGAVRYSRTSTQTPVWVTAQALTGLRGRPLPVLGRSSAGGPAARFGARWLTTLVARLSVVQMG